MTGRRKAAVFEACLDMYGPAHYTAAILRKNEDAWIEATQEAYIDLKQAFLDVDEFIRDEDRESFDVLVKEMKDRMHTFLINFTNKILNIADTIPAASSLIPASLASLRVTAAPSPAVSVQAAPDVSLHWIICSKFSEPSFGVKS